MDRAFEQIFEEAAQEEDIVRAASDTEFNTCSYLVDLLDQGSISDPGLVRLAMWIKAYRILEDLEDNPSVFG